MLRKHEAKAIISPIMSQAGIRAAHWDVIGNHLNIGIPDKVGMRVRSFKFSYRSSKEKLEHDVATLIKTLHRGET